MFILTERVIRKNFENSFMSWFLVVTKSLKLFITSFGPLGLKCWSHMYITAFLLFPHLTQIVLIVLILVTGTGKFFLIIRKYSKHIWIYSWRHLSKFCSKTSAFLNIGPLLYSTFFWIAHLPLSLLLAFSQCKTKFFANILSWNVKWYAEFFNKNSTKHLRGLFNFMG